MRKETAVLFEEAWRVYKAEPHYITADDVEIQLYLDKEEWADTLKLMTRINAGRKERYDDALDEALGKFVAAYREESLCD